MPLITEYHSLLAAFDDFLLDEAISDPNVILQIAEDRIYAEVRLRCMLTDVLLAPAGGVAALPADFLEPLALAPDNLPDASFVFVSPQEFALDHRRKQAGAAKLYTVLGDELKFAPQGSGDLLLYYYRRFTALSAAAPTNALLSFTPSLYLFAMLAEAGPYVREDGLPWEPRYEAVRSRLHGADVRAQYRPGIERRRTS